MFEIYKFSETEFIAFALMLVRISACLVTMPIFGNRDIPAHVKVLFSLLITMILFSSARAHILATTHIESQDLILLTLREAFLGTLIGFLCRGIFWAVQMAGQLLGFSIGFSAAQAFNPALGDTGTMIEQFQSILAMLLFLGINGHHWMIRAIAQSFELVPLSLTTIKTETIYGLGNYIQTISEIAVKLSAPMMAVIIFLNGAMGIVGRAVPQINTFVTSFPVNILVGLFVFMVSIPLLLTVMENDFARMTVIVFQFIKAF